ncbi:MAG: discoidin domain-containing protein [Sedimentisphaerales bacterium]|nr:discoidin domain-containing protein [Sedimentisphaerales bacterium]
MHKQTLYLACLIVSFGLAAKGQALKPFQQDSGPDGIVSMEAEHCDDNFAPGANKWVEVGPTGGFTGVKGMQCNGAGVIKEGYATAAPGMGYRINFVTTGTHYVWVRAYGATGNDDSCHMGLDREPIATGLWMSGWNGIYAWSNNRSGGQATFEIPSPGTHTVNIWVREDGLIVDKIVVTTNPDYTPEGDGPPESPRGVPANALGPNPASGATDVPRDTILSWKPGPYAAKHDVYFGTDRDAVQNAERTSPSTVLVSLGQDANTYDPPGYLTFGQTYYWRIDEFNAPPDTSMFRGGVWSFTVEPFSYPVTGVKATASSMHDATMGPEKTVDGSGLNANDEHSTIGSDMWLSSGAGAQPTWIQYEFERVSRLDKMWVWNSNQSVESIFGMGIKNATVEYSTDGVAWTPLADVEFIQAPGRDGYIHNTTVDFGGVAAKYVKITARSNWGGPAQYGLSEVRFFSVPVYASQPQPASGKVGVDVDAVLSWRAGREASVHNLYFGTDSQAVADGTALVDVVSEHSYDLGPMDLGLGNVYHWKVDEVNKVETPDVWAGSLWSFSTPEFLVVDDFEAYTNDSPKRVFQTWVDGLGFSPDEYFLNGNPGNDSGAIVGYDPSVGDVMEMTIVHGGMQSVPIEYNNVNSPYYSEAERTWETPQDWTAHGAEILRIFFRGNPLRFEDKAGTITMSAAGADIWYAADEFTFAWKPLTGNATIVAKVESVENTDPWAKAGVMIRENLRPDSRFAAVYATAGNGVRFQARLLNAGSATSDTSVATDEQKVLTAPVWIKLERNGNAFSGFYSTDGAKWTAMSWNPQTITMAGTIYIGLVVTSHATGVGCTGQFSNVSIPGVSGAWQSAEVGIDHLLNDRANLYVSVLDAAGHTATVTHSDPDAVLQDTWQRWDIPLADLQSAGANVAAVKKMCIGVGNRQSPSAGGAGSIFIDDVGVGRPGLADPGKGGLVASYAFENNLDDGSGNDHAGTAVGDPKYVQGPAGYGTALEFDGTGAQYVTMGTFNPSQATGQLTVSLWGKWNGLNGQFQGLIAKRDSYLANDMMWHFETQQDTGVIRLGREGTAQVSSEAMTVGQWEHWAFTFNGSQAIIYRNAQPIASGAFSFGTDVDAGLYVGATSLTDTGAASNPFNGALDEIRLYNRALSPFEIRYLAGQR